MKPQYRGYLFNYDRRQDVLSLEANGNMIAEDIGLIKTFFRYIHIGITHILSGVDHLVFLLGLLLLTNRLRDIVLVVTGFTIGHSLTLGLERNEDCLNSVCHCRGADWFYYFGCCRRSCHGTAQSCWQVVCLRLLFFMGLYSIIEAPMPINGWAGLMLFAVAYGFYSQNPNIVRQTLPIML